MNFCGAAVLYKKPWPNGTPNSSQLKPSFKIKTFIGGWPNNAAKLNQLERNHSIVWIWLCSHITIINKTTWLELAELGKQVWLELGKNLSLIKLKPTRSNSSQLKPSGWPNDTQLCELWLEMGVTFGQGLLWNHENLHGLTSSTVKSLQGRHLQDQSYCPLRVLPALERVQLYRRDNSEIWLAPFKFAVRLILIEMCPL